MEQFLFPNNSWVSLRGISKWHFRMSNGKIACGLEPKWGDNDWDFKHGIVPKSQQMCGRCKRRKQNDEEVVNP